MRVCPRYGKKEKHRQTGHDNRLNFSLHRQGLKIFFYLFLLAGAFDDTRKNNRQITSGIARQQNGCYQLLHGRGRHAPVKADEASS